MEMYARGYDIIGVDLSVDMLSCAKMRMLEKGMDILLINQDMTKLELHSNIDTAVCLVDGVNHVTDPRDVKRFFKVVHGLLNPGGLFIFDINTKYKLETVMGENVFYSIDDSIACIWKCSFSKPGISESDITFFKKKDGLYERFDEIIYQRAYEDTDIREYISKAGFELVDTFDGETFQKPGVKSERVYYVCRK